ncbi:hypothetical protein DL93DRAFT_2075366 [Clavulina sp. PMI_390]|nr:hypothetical protein DL93DRAFT_2075366 [Clavulina sp. PMI_390]
MPVLIRHGKEIVQREEICDALASSAELIILSSVGATQFSQRVNEVTGNYCSFSDITGIPMATIFGDSLEIADASRGTAQLDEYQIVARMLAIDPFDPTYAAVRQHEYIRRSILFLRPLLGGGSKKDAEVQERVPDVSMQIFYSWDACVKKSVPGDEMLKQIVSEGLVFLLERISLLFWDRVKGDCSNPGCMSTEEAGLRCMACKRQHYCSKECQKSHWKNHKAQCKKVASNTGVQGK